MHMIEYVGKAGAEGRTLSEIADFMNVARPSVTVSVRKLEQKGFLVKNGCMQDGRVIRVTLTREGRKVYMHHMRFHMLMVQELESGLCEEEKNVLAQAISKLDKFFEKRIEAAATR
jgi:DNA-binding MarR family transcriptional regulator